MRSCCRFFFFVAEPLRTRQCMRFTTRPYHRRCWAGSHTPKCDQFPRRKYIYAHPWSATLAATSLGCSSPELHPMHNYTPLELSADQVTHIRAYLLADECEHWRIYSAGGPSSGCVRAYYARPRVCFAHARTILGAPRAMYILGFSSRSHAFLRFTDSECCL
ncbi:hypothetical protein H4582DRAFT_182840 [Lactarius indigo]|nr:hypothetical protein H4582DRAFT_182840 [Lactarius indigo]